MTASRQHASHVGRAHRGVEDAGQYLTASPIRATHSAQWFAHLQTEGLVGRWKPDARICQAAPPLLRAPGQVDNQLLASDSPSRG